MKKRPILFSVPMVRAILEGRKTQTRRVIKPQPDADGLAHPVGADFWNDTSEREYRCLYGKPGDQLWLRETWQSFEMPDGRKIVAWKASCELDELNYVADDGSVSLIKIGKWSPSIHMPRWASRITLEITGVRVERLQEISEEDVWAEGVPLQVADAGNSGFCGVPMEPRTAFANFWDYLAKPGAMWSDDPWVWVIEFKRIEREGSEGEP